jgi:ELWxxDGT repeat protein
MNPRESTGSRRLRAGILAVSIALFSAALFVFAPFPGRAATVGLVSNINTTVIPQSSGPQSLGFLNGKMLFGARDSTGAGLWGTDGTAGGTQLIQRFSAQGFVAAGAGSFMTTGTGAYFAAGDQSGSSMVWFTDGSSAGTKQIIALPTGSISAPSLLGMLGTTLIFTSYTPSNSVQLYASDGTTAGTVALTNFSGSVSAALSQFIIVGSKFYFVAQDNVSGQQIWVSDGTVAGTHVVTIGSVGLSPTYNPQSFQQVGSLVLYTSSGVLWSIDTTTDTINPVTSSGGTPGFGPPFVLGTGPLAAMNGFILFVATTNQFTSSLELWRSDGTTAGTFKVANVAATPTSYELQYTGVQKVGDRVLYIADDGVHGQQLWSSDGTAANTFQLTNATQPANSTMFPIAGLLANIGNTAYYAVYDGANATTESVWRTDGTVAGTKIVNGIPPIDQSEAGSTLAIGDAATLYIAVHTSSGLTTSIYKYDVTNDHGTLAKSGLQMFNGDEFAYGGTLLFFGDDDPIIGDEPWVSDGTAAGTHLIEDIFPQTTDQGSNASGFVAFAGRLAFAADDGISGRELWISDGTTAGTTLLADINPGVAASNPNHLFTFGGALYFFATDASGSSKFMRIKSIGAVPEVLATLSTLSSGFAMYCGQDGPAFIGTQMYFAANDGQSGLELWTSDGTAAGTHLVADIAAGVSDSYPCYLTVLGNRVFFAAVGPQGNELWSSDGTTAGTTQVADINPGALSSSPYYLTVLGNNMYFGADDGVHGFELWKSDGTAAGTSLVDDVLPGADASNAVPLGILAGKLVFQTSIVDAQSGNYSLALWTTDGSLAGTSQLATMAPNYFVNAFVSGNHIFFVGQDASGVEPWVSDGTVTGTHILKDINPSGGSYPSWFANFNSWTLLEVTDPTLGEQLWRTDGTTAGTTLIGNIPPQPNVSPIPLPPLNRLAVGSKFYFSANDPIMGTELYSVANSAPTANADTATSTDDAAVTINVLANDTDADSTLDPGSIVITTSPAHGTAIVTNGAVAYTPSSGFAGTDSFGYTVSDAQGLASAPVNVSLTVTAPITPPPTTVVTAPRHGGGSMSIYEVIGLFALLSFNIAGKLRERRSRGI